MKLKFLAPMCLLMAGCAADRPLTTPDVHAVLRQELAPAPVASAPVVPASVAVPAPVHAAQLEALPAAAVPSEPRLDLLVNNAQARDVFLALVADTRYSMLMHPDVSGTLSVTLRGVTVTEALEAIRDVYGYDFRIEGRRITVFAPTLQTRVFTVNYPNAQRLGASELRVSSSAMQASTPATTGNGTSSAEPGAQAVQVESSRVSTSSRTDLWGELTGAVRALIGSEPGRSVIASPQAGIMAVRAMPDELRQVDRFLKAAQIAVERQVMLEAKIVQVELSDGYQSGIDWAAMRTVDGVTAAVGTLAGNTVNNILINGVSGAVSGAPAGTGGLFGLALAADGFQAVLGFMETRGDLQILSSPRIATLNNQKALFKVGTDAFFVTSVSGGTVTAGTGTTGATSTMPTLTLTPMFSGIALDVTPQIDASDNITLHVRPSVTNVTSVTQQVDLGVVGNYRLPLASSSVNESDTMVRVQDGNIVAIGGLMQVDAANNASGLPGTSDIPFLSTLLGNKARNGHKKELVVLLKPTIIRSASDWQALTDRSRAALDDMAPEHSRVIRLDGNGATGTARSSVAAPGPVTENVQLRLESRLDTQRVLAVEESAHTKPTP